jgi:hypothetical protein
MTRTALGRSFGLGGALEQVSVHADVDGRGVKVLDEIAQGLRIVKGKDIKCHNRAP